jgi:hypothetical protein
MRWQNSFDRLLKAMSQGEPHKAEQRAEKGATRPQRGVAKNEPPQG